jgi:penicillin-binding protein 2
MFEPPSDRRSQLSPQLAVRVAVLGGIALAIFALIFFRLWYLQVLSGSEYVAQASGNRVRSVSVTAPRGRLLDRSDAVLVDNESSVAVVVSPAGLPSDPDERERVLRRLSRVLGEPTALQPCEFGSGARATVRPLMPVECTVDQHVAALPYADVVVEPAASRPVFSYLAERAQQFPGVAIEDGWRRSYPLGGVGAHVFGTLGQINEQELGDPRFDGVAGGSLVGKDGLERVYDAYLRGRDGAQRIQVDALGQASRRALAPVAAIPGNDLRLSIDAQLQRVGEQALQNGIGLAQAHGNPGSGGAFVAMDTRNGEVLALGSAPSFDPRVFTRPMSQRTYDANYRESSGSPLFNRAVEGGYAIGSTFKVVTAAAALAEGETTVDRVYNDTGRWSSGGQIRRNAGGVTFGPVALVRALAVSVDTYFYDLGERLNAEPATHPRGGPLQAWARRFGFGAPTGIDLPNETSGVVSDPRHGADLWKAELRCRRLRRVDSCNIALENPVWTVGDNVSLAIGQGDFLASPLQLATAYAAIANGGTVVRPHVGLAVLDEDGRIAERIQPRPTRRIEIPQLAAIRQGLLDATSTREGTAADVFAGFGRSVYGKTGTAQIDGQPDQSWFVAYVEDPQRPIVVAAVVEDGGFGAEAAAPAVRQILSQWIYGRPGRAVAGSSTTN